MALILVSAPASAQTRGPLVLAAASLQEALSAAADRFAAQGQPRPVLSFAASSALARQITAGAPADLFVSADEGWMDLVEEAGLLAPGTRATLAGNRLALIAPTASRLPPVRTGAQIVAALGNGRIAIADPQAVPAGRYARVALSRMGAWRAIAPRVAAAENVRAALALVERGAAPLGVVYATDARASRAVRVVGVFPAASHPPIRYPIARLARSREPSAEAFRRFLLSPAGRAILRAHGFSAP
ncbi:molybdate ABC transporter substrate-binding protein [Sphingomonas qomolangmaensis]|uniref:Molybdate ABC transporter substrate-binding protein n=1 Tax=Sphingomonas qomolangmaensis TaxID=2918765 RepID=A0ABY5L9Y0_9SPHN|nr:molybdate ABC transporter substrate-binding protein [Sphingomonas qomolangmaensis]UUL82853.1 molybdate ABC transporter substrate-binding protein [Sphingomonas qomolangmaensis]